VAYRTLQPKGRVQRATRDLVFVDRRFVLLRDHVALATPGKISWLLHAEKNLSWDNATATAFIRGDKASLIAKVITPGLAWSANITDQFPVPVDQKYVSGEVGTNYVTGKWSNQSHLTLESKSAAKDFTIYAVLWPERDSAKP